MNTDENSRIQQDREIGIHDEYSKAYIQMLNTYNETIKGTIQKKNALKQDFFKVIKRIMYTLAILFVGSLLISFAIFALMILYEYKSVSVITGAVTALISSFVTMALSIIKLPEIIAEYLFDKKEDNLMNEIIKNIQNYELGMVQILKEADIHAAKDQKTKNDDSLYDENPNKSRKKPTNIERDKLVNKND